MRNLRSRSVQLDSASLMRTHPASGTGCKVSEGVTNGPDPRTMRLLPALPVAAVVLAAWVTRDTLTAPSVQTCQSSQTDL